VSRREWFDGRIRTKMDAVYVLMEEFARKWMQVLNTDPNELLKHVSEESAKFEKLGRSKSVQSMLEATPENAKDVVDDEQVLRPASIND
jgi:hypothetical protein